MQLSLERIAFYSSVLGAMLTLAVSMFYREIQGITMLVVKVSGNSNVLKLYSNQPERLKYDSPGQRPGDQ